MMYVSQVIMLYTLNLHSAVCQLYLNKTGRKKKTLILLLALPFIILGKKYKPSTFHADVVLMQAMY